GIKLETLTQALAYRAIKYREKTKRPRTEMNLDRVSSAIETLTGRRPASEKIWRNLRNNDISKKCQELLYNAIHDIFFVGDKWLRDNMPIQYQARAFCQVHQCQQTEESMEHIVTTCAAPGQELIWSLTKQIWEMKGEAWPGKNYGLILGCMTIDFAKDESREEKLRKAGVQRFFRIIATEAFRLIWAIRCERVIAEKQHSEVEIHNRWLYRINARLHLDQALARKSTFGNHALRETVVKNTWRNTLLNEKNLSERWVREPGVLVGI
ncbi:hypothetical protein FISHEDRAFT_6462, partial [Fistulina hepatica ATCC 64428]